MIMRIIKRKKITIVNCFLIALFLFGFSNSFSLAQSSNVISGPAIYISDIQIDSPPQKGGDKITGRFTVLNKENYVLGNLSWGINLYKVKTTVNDGIATFVEERLVDYHYDSNTYSFAPDLTKEINFAYSLPNNLLSGDYYLQIILKNPELFPLAWQYYELGNISGNNNYILPTKIAVISLDGKEYPALVGVRTDIDKSPQLRIEAIASGGKAINAFYKIKVYERMPWGKLLYEQVSSDKILFKPDVSTKIAVDLPKLGIPGSFSGEISFWENNNLVSPIENFRWVIAGATARVLLMKVDKNNYNAGDIAKVELMLADRPDLVSPGKISEKIQPLSEVKLLAEIICENNKRAAKESIVKISPSLVTIEIPVNFRGEKCGAMATMIKDDTTLHQYIADFDNVIASQAGSPSVAPSGEKLSKFWIIAGVLIVIILIGGYIIILNKKKQNTQF